MPGFGRSCLCEGSDRPWFERHQGDLIFRYLNNLIANILRVPSFSAPHPLDQD
jgi:hypothetical protein